MDFFTIHSKNGMGGGGGCKIRTWKSQTQRKSPVPNLNNHIITSFLLFYWSPPPPIFIPFEDSGLLGYDTVMIVSLVLDDMKEHGTLIFKGQAVHILWPSDPWIWRHHIPSNHQKPLTWQHWEPLISQIFRWSIPSVILSRWFEVLCVPHSYEATTFSITLCHSSIVTSLLHESSHHIPVSSS